MPQSARFITIVLVGAAFLGGVSPVKATTTYYVSQQGNDSSNGTQDAPFRTLQKAINGVIPGDTIIVKDGTYEGVEVKKSGNDSAKITIRAENKGKAKIVVPQSLNKHGFYFYPAVSHVNVSGFDISGGQAGFLLDEGAHDIMIAGNTLHDIGRFCTDTGLGLVGTYMEEARNITFEGNILFNIGRFSPGENGCQPTNAYYKNHDHGVYINGSDSVLLKNNVFMDFNHGWAVQLYSSGGLTSKNIKIVNNTFAFDNPEKTGQIILSGKMNTVQIANNIFHQPRNAAIDFFEPSMTNVTVSKNLVSGAGMFAAQPSGMTSSGNIENTNPLFVDAPSRDFHLQSGSPAIQAGLPLSEVQTDFDGTPRSPGSAHDLGAFEFSSGTTSSSSCLSTDINQDGTVNILDYWVLLKNFLRNPVVVSRADVNHDGAVNTDDARLLIQDFFATKAC